MTPTPNYHFRIKRPTNSRDDAMRMTRNEKILMLYMMHSVGIIECISTDMSERLSMIEKGQERAKKLCEDANALLEELRVTIPMNQRIGLENIAADNEIRIVPSATPSEKSVLLDKDSYKELVESARIRCRDCADDDFECEHCELYQLLTVISPMDNYNGLHLCPYNLARWVES